MAAVARPGLLYGPVLLIIESTESTELVTMPACILLRAGVQGSDSIISVLNRRRFSRFSRFNN